jgi:uncharacterized RDD family membrane protein YckC
MENHYQDPNPQENLLDDFDAQLVQANAGQRLANFLIDMFSFYAFLFAISYIIPSLAAMVFTPLVPTILYAVYISIVELAFNGKTLGKLVTGTRAVQDDGNPITSSNAFTRGFSRIVPFEVFSAFGSPTYPWHDKWSHTYVISERSSRGT